MHFEFASAGRILFGPGSLSEVAPLVGPPGTRAMVVTGADPGRAAPLLRLLADGGIHAEVFSVPGEPTVQLIREGVAAARTKACQALAAFGGGSVIDAGKAIAILLVNSGDPLDYLEVIGAGKPLSGPGVPFVAIPTTAGTGSEVTRNAVIGSPEHRVKVSLRSVHMLARAAIVDPDLTRSLPAAITAASGMDALTQLIEPFVSNRANPLTDALCMDGIPRIARSIRTACAAGDNPGAREEMSLASLCGGLALANARLGAVHGFAGPLGGLYPAPHGALCARLLPEVMAINVDALRRRNPDSLALTRYDRVSRSLVGSDSATAEDGVRWLRALVADLGVPTLATYGIAESEFGEILPRARAASSMQGNPIVLTDPELTEVLMRAL